MTALYPSLLIWSWLQILVLAPHFQVKITIKILFFLISVFVNSQFDWARLQVQGLGVPELHVQALRGSDPARHHPHIHEGREGLMRSNRERAVVEEITTKKQKQTFTDTGSGPGAPLVLEASLTASQSKFNHHNLFRSAQPPQELLKALPHYLGCLYCIPVLSLAIALRPPHQLGH